MILCALTITQCDLHNENGFLKRTLFDLQNDSVYNNNDLCAVTIRLPDLV